MSAPRIVVMTGTDHHPFDRLVSWVDDWLAGHPEAVASCYVQYGTSAARPRCPGSASLPVGQLGDLLDQADVLICHGGPASVSDAWRRGRVPIVVPRTLRLGEHVDDHQVDFCRKFAELGRVRLAEDQAGFASLLAEAAADPAALRAPSNQADIDLAVEQFGKLVADLIGGRPRRRPMITRARRARQAGAVAAAGEPPTGTLPPDHPVGATGTEFGHKSRIGNQQGEDI